MNGLGEEEAERGQGASEIRRIPFSTLPAGLIDPLALSVETMVGFSRNSRFKGCSASGASICQQVLRPLPDT